MHRIRAATLTGFSDLVRDLRREPEPLIAAAGFAPEALEPANEDQYLSHRRFERLLQLATQATDCPHFAVLLGSRQQLTMLGLLGFVMQQAPDVGSALAEVQRHFYLQAHGSSVGIEMGRNTVYLYFEVEEAHRLGPIDRGAELCLGAGSAILKTLCGDRWRPTAVHFAHRPPGDSLPFRRILGAPVSFNQERNAVFFPTETLSLPLDGADPHLARVLHTYLGLLDDRYSDDVPAQVAHLIRRALASGNCSADKVAAFMGLHRRSLHRLLKTHGTSFSELLEAVRRDTATRSLAGSDMPVTLLSDMLGYADTSAFSRAFRRWYGVSPRRWRERERQKARKPMSPDSQASELPAS